MSLFLINFYLQLIIGINHPFPTLDDVFCEEFVDDIQYLNKTPDFVMGNVICAIQSILTGLGDCTVYLKRIEDTLAQDPNCIKDKEV